jgi:type VI secretion system protein ImpC
MTSAFTPTELIDRLGARAAALAEAVSLAIRIEPQLLRRARIELFPNLDAGVEADVWFSPIAESRAPSGIVLRPLVAHALRQRLATRPALLDAAWTIVESLHRNISPAMFAEERLAYFALSGRYTEMRELLRSVVATLASRRGRSLAPWAARAVRTLPDEAKFTEEAQMISFGATLRLEDAPLAGGIPLLRAADWAGWLSPEDFDTVPFGVTLLEDAIEFGSVGRPLSHRLDLPKTVPVVADLSWKQGLHDRQKRVVLDSNKTTVVDLGTSVDEVEIRTMLGDAYTLAVPERPRPRESTQKKLSRVRPPRVHISYDVEVGDAIEKRELPFVVGVLAPLSGDPADPLPRLRERQFYNIDADNFDQVMDRVRPLVRLRLADPADPDRPPTQIELRFGKLDDFQPIEIARNVPWLNELLTKRTHLAKVTAGLAEWEGPAFRTFVDVALRVAREPVPDTILNDAVRTVIQTGKLSAEDASTFLAEVRNAGPVEDLTSAAQDRIAAFDRELSGHLREILHHPSFQRLESIWRGIHYLVSNTESSEMLKIRVLNVDKRDLLRDFASAPEFDQTALFAKVYEATFGDLGGEPFGMLVGAWEFTHSAPDVELLQKMCAIAASAHAPFLAGASPEMFLLREYSEMEAVRDLDEFFSGPEFTAWNALRDSDDSRYTALTLPRVLLRLPYGRDAAAVEEFDFQEIADASDRSQFLWGSAAFAFAARVTNAFAMQSWCAAIRGVEGGGLVEGLPVYTFFTDAGDVALRCSTEIAIEDPREAALSKAGFLPLCHCKDTDYAAFFSVNTIQRARQYMAPEADANARLALQLPYIFAVSRFAHYIKCMMRDKIGFFMSRSDVETYLNQWIAQYVFVGDFSGTEISAKYPLREARIDVTETPGRPGLYRCIAFLRPHFQLEELTVALRVVVQLPAPLRK